MRSPTRAAIRRKVNPVVPVQLIVDHSLAVECGGFDPDAFAKNRAIEDRRNEDRFHFIDWTKRAFKQRRCDSAGQRNHASDQSGADEPGDRRAGRRGLPGHLRRHRQPHAARGRARRDRDRRRRPGSGERDARARLVDALPDIIGVELSGKPQPGITATDIVLSLTEFLRKQKVVGAYLEFRGPGAAALTLGDRATISNMAPEYGATAAMFFIDQNTLDYLRLTGRSDAQVALVESYAKTAGLWADALANAQYERTLHFDLSTVVRTMAGPSNPHARVATSDLAAKGIAKAWTETPGQMPDGAVIIAAITSCTNTSNPRNVIAAGLLARNARNAPAWCASPGSSPRWRRAPRRSRCTCRKLASKEDLEALGFGIVAFACTTCNGMSGALDPAIQKEIVERDLYATAVLSGNRNFDGRIHPYAKQAFLASPPLVVAYAIAGTIRFDIEKDALGHRADGTPVLLKDLWPSDAEIDALVKSAVKPEQFRAVYEPMFKLAVDSGEKVSPLYDWRRRAPTSAARRTGRARWPSRARLSGMRPLAILPDNITTDHLSPSNAILLDSAAGEYLAKMGLPEEDFNSYATHRGDHLTAQRATFANPTLKNEMVRKDDGSVRAGSLARVEPEGQVMRMWEAIETYMERGQPLDHHRRRRLRSGQLTRLGRQGRAPGRRGGHRGRELRTHPSHQPDRHGRAAAGVPARHHAPDAGPGWHRDLRRARRAHPARHADAADPPP
jgi:aconitase A